MRIPHGALVLVADGRKLVLFRNAGDGVYPALKEVDKVEDDNPPARVQKSDAPGHVRASGGGGRSAYDDCNYHMQEEAQFAKQAAALLSRQVATSGADGVIVAADPRTLGEMRRHYTRRVKESLIGEIAKDLVKQPVVEIEEILSAE